MKSFQPSFLALLSLITLALTQPAWTQEKPREVTDVVVFKNGDQLTGKFERSTAGNIIFKSDVVGEVTISLDKVKELRPSSSYVVIKKDEKITRVPKQPVSVVVEDSTLKETLPTGAIETIPAKDVGYVIDAETYHKQL